MVPKKGEYTEILIRQGVISPDQLAEAQQMADESGIPSPTRSAGWAMPPAKR